MITIIRILAIFVIGWILLQSARKYVNQRKQESVSQKSKPEPVDNMVQCAKCGTHVPSKEAFTLDERYYCSETCRKAQQNEDNEN